MGSRRGAESSEDAACSVVSSESGLPAQETAATGSGANLTFEHLAGKFHLPINVAAKHHGICVTVLKKQCRRFGVLRWPHRKLKSIERQVAKLREEASGASPESREFYLQELNVMRRKRDHVIRTHLTPDAASHPMACMAITDPLTSLDVVKQPENVQNQAARDIDMVPNGQLNQGTFVPPSYADQVLVHPQMAFPMPQPLLPGFHPQPMVQQQPDGAFLVSYVPPGTREAVVHQHQPSFQPPTFPGQMFPLSGFPPTYPTPMQTSIPGQHQSYPVYKAPAPPPPSSGERPLQPKGQVVMEQSKEKNGHDVGNRRSSEPSTPRPSQPAASPAPQRHPKAPTTLSSPHAENSNGARVDTSRPRTSNTPRAAGPPPRQSTTSGTVLISSGQATTQEIPRYSTEPYREAETQTHLGCSVVEKTSSGDDWASSDEQPKPVNNTTKTDMADLPGGEGERTTDTHPSRQASKKRMRTSSSHQSGDSSKVVRASPSKLKKTRPGSTPVSRDDNGRQRPPSQLLNCHNPAQPSTQFDPSSMSLNVDKVMGVLNLSVWSTDYQLRFVAAFGLQNCTNFHGRCARVGESIFDQVREASVEGLGVELDLLEPFLQARKGHRVQMIFEAASGCGQMLQILSPLVNETDDIVGVSGLCLSLAHSRSNWQR